MFLNFCPFVQEKITSKIIVKFDSPAWSIGVIMFVMIFNCPPFWAKDTQGIYRKCARPSCAMSSPNGNTPVTAREYPSGICATSPTSVWALVPGGNPCQRRVP